MCPTLYLMLYIDSFNECLLNHIMCEELECSHKRKTKIPDFVELIFL